jgi:hypothetical protein
MLRGVRSMGTTGDGIKRLFLPEAQSSGLHLPEPGRAPQCIETIAAPSPLLGLQHQTALHGIVVHVIQLLFFEVIHSSPANFIFNPVHSSTYLASRFLQSCEFNLRAERVGFSFRAAHSSPETISRRRTLINCFVPKKPGPHGTSTGFPVALERRKNGVRSACPRVPTYGPPISSAHGCYGRRSSNLAPRP